MSHQCSARCRDRRSSGGGDGARNQCVEIGGDRVNRPLNSISRRGVFLLNTRRITTRRPAAVPEGRGDAAPPPPPLRRVSPDDAVEGAGSSRAWRPTWGPAAI
jgi:hypothetical protein